MVLEEKTYIIKVKDHKTGVMGCARLMFEKDIKVKLDQYFQYVRPKLVVPGKDCAKFVYTKW